MNLLLLIFGLFLIMLIIGAPIGVALGLPALLVMLFSPLLPPGAAFRAFFGFVSSYPLMAIPFFVFAGLLMERAGLIKKMFDFADALTMWLPGGFGYAVQISAVIFGAITGSSTAMAAAMGVIGYPELIRRQYPPWLAAGLIAGSGSIAMLVPPSVILIIFGVLTKTNIVQLFFAGIIPGILLAISNMIVIPVIAAKWKLPRREFDPAYILKSAKNAWQGLLMPVLVLGGLYGGVFTPTEAGAAAFGYALLYWIATKWRHFAEFKSTMHRAMQLNAFLFLLLGGVGVFQVFLANTGWPMDVADWIVSLGMSPLGFAAVVLLVQLFLSAFLSGIAVVVLTVPVIMPAASLLGIDFVWLGILVVLAQAIGVCIPPVGLDLFAASGTTGVPLQQVFKGALPFEFTNLWVVVVVFIFPSLALWLPGKLFQPIF